MKKIICIMFSIIFPYSVGDIVSTTHQNQEFDLCFPNSMDNVMSLGDYNGNTNGGDYNILVIDMSATWCGPCVSLIPLFDELAENYSNNESVEFFVALSDLNQPYSCTQWGNMGDSDYPKIIDDTGYPIFNMFNTSSSFPSLVLIDHEMRVQYKEAGYYPTFVGDMTVLIDEMLYNMDNSLILYNELFFTIDESSDDGDGLLNPGESFNIDFIINNNSFALDALNVSVNVQNDEDIIFDLNNISFGNINVTGASVGTISGTVNSDVTLGNHEIDFEVIADFIDLNGNSSEYSNSFTYDIDITLDQLGFPYNSSSNIKGSPIVIDFDNDGNKEIIFGDYTGMVHVLDNEGNEIENDIFPFDTGDQIWSSLAGGYIDQDNNFDIVVTSKSEHLFVLDNSGLKLDYNANDYLLGTPALGNLDDDEDLEIVFGSFASNNAKLYAINLDGSNVDGFPLIIDEKMQKGIALADFNNNGKDDIVVGTDDDNIYLIYEDGTIAPGFPYSTGDKLRSAPIILDSETNQKIIVVGSKDDNIYGVNENGNLHFQFESDGNVETSPSVLDTGSGILIFFGTSSGSVYALDLNGNLQEGFPISNNSGQAIAGSIVFDDLDSDGFAEIIFGDEGGKLYVLKTIDSTYTIFEDYNNTPTSSTFPYSSSLNVMDIDNDGDSELFAGTAGNMVVFDIKEAISDDSYWSIFRYNYHRNGLFYYESLCSAGDINNDGILDILDIVSLVNIIMNPTDISDLESCASDINNDSVIDILDIVNLVNQILN